MRQVERGDSHQGQGIVEFALVIPIFLLLVFGTIEFGWLLFANHSATNATREGARYAMVNGERSGSVATVSSVNDVVVEYAGRFGDRIETTRVEFDPDPEPGNKVTVETRFLHEPIVGMIIGTGELTLTNESTVIVQY